MNAGISLETVLVRRSDLMVSELSEKELVMLNVQFSSYYGMDETAKIIWDYLNVPHSIGELVDYLLSHFAVDRQTCEREVMAFAKDMLQHELVRAVNETL